MVLMDTSVQEKSLLEKKAIIMERYVWVLWDK